MALTIIDPDENKTLPLGMPHFVGQFTANCNGLAKEILPLLIAYTLLQRYIVSGLAAGAVKG